MSITPVLKIACDLCGDPRHMPARASLAAPPPLPDRWHHTANRGIQGPDYCLDGVEIICDTCHAKLAKLKEQIRAESTDDKAEPPKFISFGDEQVADAVKHTVTARLDGRDIYFEGCKWRYEDTGDLVNPHLPEKSVKHSITSSLDGRDCYWDKNGKAWRWAHNNDVLPIPKHLESLLPESIDTNDF